MTRRLTGNSAVEGLGGYGRVCPHLRFSERCIEMRYSLLSVTNVYTLVRAIVCPPEVVSLMIVTVT